MVALLMVLPVVVVMLVVVMVVTREKTAPPSRFPALLIIFHNLYFCHCAANIIKYRQNGGGAHPHIMQYTTIIKRLRKLRLLTFFLFFDLDFHDRSPGHLFDTQIWLNPEKSKLVELADFF